MSSPVCEKRHGSGRARKLCGPRRGPVLTCRAAHPVGQTRETQWPEQVGGTGQGCPGRGAEPGAGGSGHSADQPFRRGPAAGQRGSSQGALGQTLQPGACVLTGASQKPHPQEYQEWQPKPKAEGPMEQQMAP